MKLAFWRRDDAELSPPFDLAAYQPFRFVALPPDKVRENLEDALVAKFGDEADVRRQLGEVTAERDELLQALDEDRPAPTRYVLGAVLEQQWHRHATAERTTTEAWACVADHAIDYVRGLWPLNPAGRLDPADVAALDTEAERRLHTDEHGCDRYPFCTCPTAYEVWRVGDLISGDQARRDLPDGAVLRVEMAGYIGDLRRVVGTTPEGLRPEHRGVVGHGEYRIESLPETSPGAPGQRFPVAAAGRELGSVHAPGDTTPPVPAEAPPAGTGDLADEVDAHLERLAIWLATAAGTSDSSTWNLMLDAYREVYREFATQVALAGWLPPGIRRASGNVVAVAEVLVDHEWLDDDTCRCGWDENSHAWAPVHHVEHVAQQLLGTGVLA